ncbi:isocitrate lyase/phosphoenolpyruvate mutase family protein [Actinokineospora soli]
MSGEKAQRFRALHGEGLLVLPNAWDAASARVVADAGFSAVATSSVAVAAVLGYRDGEDAPWSEMFAAAGRIAAAVPVPVTVDAEAGYGMAPGELVDRLLEAGVAGCNLEDTDHRAGGLRDPDEHADWLAGVRAAAGESLVVNARVDAFLPHSGVPEPERLSEAVRRGRRYLEAGVDCVYPIGVRDKATITALVRDLPGPVNGNTSDELTLDVLRDIGVARVTYGPRFHFAALDALRTALSAL